MLVGYNTNISYKDKIYHIQTEDSGQSNPVILTLLYSKGAILASKKTGYAHIIAEPDFEDKVRTIMRVQHKEMIKELLSGKYTGEHKLEETEVEEVERVGEVREVEKVKEIEGEQRATVGAPDGPENQRQDVETRGQIAKSLDDILLNYIMKRAK
jgi:hypothetical protein